MNRVEKFLTELIGIAKDLSPEAEISTSTVSLEGEVTTFPEANVREPGILSCLVVEAVSAT